MLGIRDLVGTQSGLNGLIVGERGLAFAIANLLEANLRYFKKSFRIS